jgi:hypothetical protein
MWLKALLKTPSILLFFAFLLLPLSARFTGFPQVKPLEEYRKLAERPALRDYVGGGKADVLGYFSRIDAWFSDQFPTRPLWVRMHTQALYSAFHESDRIHVGQGGWLFYRDKLDEDLPQIERLTPETRQAMVARLVRLSDLLAARGITLYVMPLGLKDRYYPEHLPASAQHARRFRAFDWFVDELRNTNRIQVVDTRATLEAAKAGGLKIFHRTDFHWTDQAGAEAIRPFLRSLGAREGKQAFADTWSYAVTPLNHMSGGEARAMPLFEAPWEDSMAAVADRPITIFEPTTPRPNIELQGVALAGQVPRFEPIFVYGDSYFDAETRAGFFNMFSAYSRARIFQNDLTEAFRNRQPNTKYMLLEYIITASLGVDNYVTAFIAALEREPNL